MSHGRALHRARRRFHARRLYQLIYGPRIVRGALIYIDPRIIDDAIRYSRLHDDPILNDPGRPRNEAYLTYLAGLDSQTP